MKLKTVIKSGTLLGIIGAILVVLAVLGGSWIITCVIVKSITMCFGWSFSWTIATGIWLIMCLARSVFKSNTTIKK